MALTRGGPLAPHGRRAGAAVMLLSIMLASFPPPAAASVGKGDWLLAPTRTGYRLGLVVCETEPQCDVFLLRVSLGDGMMGEIPLARLTARPAKARWEPEDDGVGFALLTQEGTRLVCDGKVTEGDTSDERLNKCSGVVAEAKEKEEPTSVPSNPSGLPDDPQPTTGLTGDAMPDTNPHPIDWDAIRLHAATQGQRTAHKGRDDDVDSPASAVSAPLMPVGDPRRVSGGLSDAGDLAKPARATATKEERIRNIMSLGKDKKARFSALHMMQLKNMCADPTIGRNDPNERDIFSKMRVCPWWSRDPSSPEPSCPPSEALHFSFEKEYGMDPEDMAHLFELFGPARSACNELFFGAMAPADRWKFFKQTYLDQLPVEEWSGRRLLDIAAVKMGPGAKNTCEVTHEDDKMHAEHTTTMYQRRDPGQWWLSRCLEEDNDRSLEIKSSSFEYSFTAMEDHMAVLMKGKPGGYEALQIHVTFPQSESPALRRQLWAVAIYLSDWVFLRTLSTAVYDKYNSPFSREVQDLLMGAQDRLTVDNQMNNMDKLKMAPVGLRLGVVYGDDNRAGFELRKGGSDVVSLARSIIDFFTAKTTTTTDDGTVPALCLGGATGSQCRTIEQISHYVTSCRLAFSNAGAAASLMATVKDGKKYGALRAPLARHMAKLGYHDTPTGDSFSRSMRLLLDTDWAQLPGVRADADEVWQLHVETQVNYLRAEINTASKPASAWADKVLVRAKAIADVLKNKF